MAKNKIFLHVGPEPRALTHADLTEHRSLLAGAGCLVPHVAQSALDAAASEMLRNHRALGLRRRDVEGAWAGVTRGLWRLGTDVVISQPQFIDADDEQFALISDHLAGLDLHVVVLTRDDRPAPLPTWATTRLAADRLHQRDVTDDAAAIDLAETLTGIVWSVRRNTEHARLIRSRRWLPAARRRTPRVA